MDFLTLVRSLAKRDAPPTSEDLRRALAEAETAATEGQTRCAELAAKRAETLLDADDKTLDRIERELQLGQRDADRADIAAATLRQRLIDAEAAEKAAEIERLYEEGLALQEAGITAIQRDYAKLARQLGALLTKLKASEATIESINRQLREAGDQRSLGPIDGLARPGGHSAPLLAAVRLPGVDAEPPMIWGEISWRPF